MNIASKFTAYQLLEAELNREKLEREKAQLALSRLELESAAKLRKQKEAFDEELEQCKQFYRGEIERMVGLHNGLLDRFLMVVGVHPVTEKRPEETHIQGMELGDSIPRSRNQVETDDAVDPYDADSLWLEHQLYQQGTRLTRD